MGWDGLGWAGLGWAGLGWAGLGWAGLGWAGLAGSILLARMLPQGSEIGCSEAAGTSKSPGLSRVAASKPRRWPGWQEALPLPAVLLPPAGEVRLGQLLESEDRQVAVLRRELCVMARVMKSGGNICRQAAGAPLLLPRRCC
jgi:hypothetical protein